MILQTTDPLQSGGTTSADNKPCGSFQLYSFHLTNVLRAYVMPGAGVLILFFLKLQKVQPHADQAEEILWILLKISSAQFPLHSAAGTNQSRDIGFEGGFQKLKTKQRENLFLQKIIFFSQCLKQFVLLFKFFREYKKAKVRNKNLPLTPPTQR